MRLLLLLWFLSTIAANAYDLGSLLAWQRRSYAAAVVTSGFYDSRGVSRYRSRPGLHLGYDIAMPWGSAARAAWPGTVVAIVPWHGSEYGVTVQHADGSTATYGHIAPSVTLGARLEAGDTVGTIASDHLDVKMRDAQGTPFDFGASGVVSMPSLPALAPVRPDPGPARQRVATLLLYEARRSAPDPRHARLQALGLRKPEKAEKSRFSELLQAWQDYQALEPSPTRWSHQQDLEREWHEARQALEKASQLYEAGLVPKRRLELAHQEEKRRRRLLEIARTL